MSKRVVSYALVPLFAAAFVGLLPGVAFASSCNFVSGSVGVSMAGGVTSTLARDPAGAITLDGSQCGTATVDTAQIISVGGAGGTLVLDLANGGFAPGSVAQTDGLSEIPISWNTTGTPLEILGDPAAADDIRHMPAGGLNLDGDGDSDINFNNLPTFVTIDGRGGDDYVDLARGNGNGNPAWDATIDGGDGNDVLRGDTGTDTIDGGPGQDQIADGLGSDGTVSGGDGDDLLYAGKTQHEVTFTPNHAIPDSGTATDTINVNNLILATDFEVHVTVTHPALSTLTLALSHSGGTPLTLAAGRSGTGYYGTVFDDSATPSINAGSGTYTGRFRPSGGTLASLGESVSGAWTLSVTDDTGDGQSGTLVSWELDLVGGAFGASYGNETYDGGNGTDTLSYAGRTEGHTFVASSPTAGTETSVGEADSYTAVESLVGSDSSDTFDGSSGADHFAGGPGNDSVTPRAGDDVVDCGGPGDEDTVVYSDAPGAMTIDLGMQFATGYGSDTIVGCEDAEGAATFANTFFGTSGPNTMIGGSAADTFSMKSGDDTAYPNGGADSVDAGSGDDTINGSIGDGDADTYTGGDGTDTINLDSNPMPAAVSLDDAANDGVEGEGDNVHSDIENVTTGAEDDTITGSSGTNVLDGGPGNDTVEGMGGGDTLYGGTGTDTVSEAHAPGPVLVDLGMMVAGNGPLDFVSGFENVVGSAYADNILGDSGPNVIRPGADVDDVSSGGGDDTLVAEPTPDGADTWSPGAGSDTADYSLRLSGVTVTLDDEANDGAAGEGDDIPNDVEVVRGGLAGDSVVGGIGANTFYGGPGNDTLLGRGGADLLYGEDGDDVVLGSSGNDTLDGGIGNDTVNGGEGDDRLLGGTGNDTVIGGTGDDDEFGQDGTDRFLEGDTSGANGSDLLVGGTGTDTASYSGRAAGVTVDPDGQFDDGQAYEQDNVSRDIEVVEGTAYNDTLTGNELANTLRGLGGNDRLTGLLGNDTLDGGTGDDTFVESSVSSGADVYIGGTGLDSVDYRARTAGLRIDLDGAADDGASGEGDNVRADVEYVYGGSGNDTLGGNAYSNRLFGGNGNDVLTGGGGADVLDGGAGNDVLYGRDGVRDTLLGGTGTDKAQRDAIDTVASIESYLA